MSTRVPIAILGSGNIGTDLLLKVLKSEVLCPRILVGIDPESDGLARAKDLGVDVVSNGIDGLLAHPEFESIGLFFDATSAKAHLHHSEVLRAKNKRVIDLTPAAVGPYVVPPVNLEDAIASFGKDAPNVNLVTCGGQATIPMVYAIKRVSDDVPYAEIIASISSRSAGPGTRANIDEFTETTSRGIEKVGGATRGKAIIVLNPAEPSVVMRDTVHALSVGATEENIRKSIEEMVEIVQDYVPGYVLKQPPVFEDVDVTHPDLGPLKGKKVSVFLEVTGAGDYLPAYAGNLDIMTAAAIKVGEEMLK
ncbi:MAG: acetaldehyde dehydrogenase (acetylating) [Deltaproteobacteria bacterium]|nr:acetaldehyde dehydrogenase (acetylating) [Deltaproteobacteria bacterium]